MKDTERTQKLGLTSSKSNLSLWLPFTPLNATSPPLRNDSGESAVLFSDLWNSNLSASVNCFGSIRRSDEEFGHRHGVCLTTSLFSKGRVYLHCLLDQSNLSFSVSAEPVDGNHSLYNYTRKWTGSEGGERTSSLFRSRATLWATFNDSTNNVTRCYTMWHALTPCLLTFWMWAMRLAQPFSTKGRFSLRMEWQHNSGLPTESIKEGGQQNAILVCNGSWKIS